MLRLVNKDRKKHGLKALFMQNDLRIVARDHSKDMARRNYFEHENLQGKSHADRYTEARISDVISGENLAKIGGFPHPVNRAEIGLMNSPGHRANILNVKYNCVGVGIHKSDKKVYYFTQNFAYRTLIFSKNPSSTVKLKKGLRLKIKGIPKVQMGVYRIKDLAGQIIKEKGFPVSEKVQELHIPFRETGSFHIELYSGNKGGKSLQISNRIKIRVVKGLFS